MKLYNLLTLSMSIDLLILSIFDVYRFLKGVMVRLMLVLAPVMCILSSIGVSSILDTYVRNLEQFQRDKKPAGKRADSQYPYKNEVT